MFEQFWFLQSLEAFVYFVLVIAAVWAFIYGIRFGVKYLKDKDLWDKALQIVRAIEQQSKYLDVPPERKKEIAMNALRNAAALLKVNVTDEQLDWLIEAAVQIMNSQLGEIFAEITEEDPEEG